MSDDSVTTVNNFLDLLAARKLAEATDYLGDEAVMIFPGQNTFTTLSDFTNWAGSRYQSIEKHIEGFETISSPDSTTIVYCFGTLNGRWTNGAEFRDIRFIDRFVVKAGKILRQDVWNDLAESHPL